MNFAMPREFRDAKVFRIKTDRLLSALELPWPIKMAVTIKLFSDSTTARKDVTGEPSQVYDMPNAPAWLIKQIQAGNALSIFRIDNNCEWLHLVHPQVVDDLHGNPEWIVGNSSDVLGEYRLIKIKVSQLRYFPIIGESGLLPVSPEASEAIEITRLRGGTSR